MGLPRSVSGSPRSAVGRHCTVVALWEVSLLCRVGKVRLGRTLAAFVDDPFSNRPTSRTNSERRHSSKPTRAARNDDPFDALICASPRSRLAAPDARCGHPALRPREDNLVGERAAAKASSDRARSDASWPSAQPSGLVVSSPWLASRLGTSLAPGSRLGLGSRQVLLHLAPCTSLSSRRRASGATRRRCRRRSRPGGRPHT
jgi:hypothetical protein